MVGYRRTTAIKEDGYYSASDRDEDLIEYGDLIAEGLNPNEVIPVASRERVGISWTEGVTVDKWERVDVINRRKCYEYASNGAWLIREFMAKGDPDQSFN